MRAEFAYGSREPVRPTEAEYATCHAHDGRLPMPAWFDEMCCCTACARVRRHDRWVDANREEEP